MTTKMKKDLPDYMEVEYLKIALNLAELNVDYYHTLLFLKVQEKQKELGSKFSVDDGVKCKFWVEENWEAFNESAKQWVLKEIKKRGGKIPESK